MGDFSSWDSIDEGEGITWVKSVFLSQLTTTPVRGQSFSRVRWHSQKTFASSTAPGPTASEGIDGTTGTVRKEVGRRQG